MATTRTGRGGAAAAVGVALALLAAGCSAGTEDVASGAAGTTTVPAGPVDTEPPGRLPQYVAAAPGSAIAERDRRMWEQGDWPSAGQLTECSQDPQKSSYQLGEGASVVQEKVFFPPGTLTVPEQVDEFAPTRSRPWAAIEFRLTPSVLGVIRGSGREVNEDTVVVASPSFLRAVGESTRGATVSVQFGFGLRAATEGLTGDGTAMVPKFRQYSQRPDGSLVVVSNCPTAWMNIAEKFADWLGDRGPSSVAGLLDAARDPVERKRLQALEDAWNAETRAADAARPHAPAWDAVDPSARVYGDAPPPAGVVLVPFSIYFEPPTAWRDGTALLCTRTVDAWNPCQPMSEKARGETLLSGVHAVDQDVEVWILGGATTQRERAYVVGRLPRELLDDRRRPVFGVADEALAASPPLRDLPDKSAVKDRGELTVLRFGGGTTSKDPVDSGGSTPSTVP